MSMYGAKASAHDIEVANTDGVTIYYSWIKDRTELAVCNRSGYFSSYSGNVVIPQSVVYYGSTYSVTSISSEAFYYCSDLTSVTIPGSVTSIGDVAFYGCNGLTSVTISNGVTSIGYSAFSECSGLTTVNIPNSVTSIGYSAFKNCSGLTSVTIPASVTSIGSEAFYNCNSLTSVTIPGSVTTIGESTFYHCSSLTSVTIPGSVTTIGKSAFYNCSSLTSVTIPGSVTSIGDYAFSSCTGLTSVTIPNSVTSIGESAFYYCSSLTSVTIPTGVTTIGQSAFSRCSSLTSVTIPGSVTSIGSYAFSGCISITLVKSYITEPYPISKDVFSDEIYRNAILNVPAGTETLYLRNEGWREFLNIEEMDASEQPVIPDAEKCATPTISYENGKLSFSCPTEGVNYKYKIEANDAKEGIGNDIQMTKTYKVTVYAFKEGMNNSDPASADITITSGKDGDVNGDGVVNAADVVKITHIIMGAE